MKRKAGPLGAAVLLCFAVVPGAFAQDAELDVTMDVLDDVSEIDGVILSIDAALGAERRGGREDPAERPPADTERRASGAADEPAPDRVFGGAREFDPDYDEEGESRVEDYDVEQDPPPSAAENDAQ